MTRSLAHVARAVAFAALVAPAFAQQPPAAAPDAAAAVPKHECGKPSEYPGNLASDNQKKQWQKEYVAYVDCVKKFIEQQQALAEPHVKASNAAINEYNAAVKAYNEIAQKANGG